MRTPYFVTFAFIGFTFLAAAVFVGPSEGRAPLAAQPEKVATPPTEPKQKDNQPDKSIVEPAVPTMQGAARIEIVFALDTTGSMSSLIDGAKRKIWAIANAVTKASPRPQILMGMVAYRDRGDQYVTKITPLTEDLDLVYSNLMALAAAGGGDDPESVNQAIDEALNKCGWSTVSQDPKTPTLQILYLVGDCPPHMDYKDDVKYTQSCALAAERGVFINTIQCGENEETTTIWQKIALEGKGAFFKIEQSGGVKTIPTPFDAELAKLGSELQATLVDYGDKSVMASQTAKREMQQEVAAKGAAPAGADRVVFNNSGAGQRNLIGSQELVDDVAAGKVKLKDIPKDHLSKAMQEMKVAEREKLVQEKTLARQKIRADIDAVSKKREAFLRDAEKGEKQGSFDAAVVESLREQAAKRKIVIPEEK
jgi:hypothetical protein